MNQLKKRILDISYKHGLSHLGSCLTAVDIIDEIYRKKKPEEKFVLSAGHAGLALYCVVEKYEGIDAEKIWKHHGTHPDRCAECHIDCSTGSLGQGLPIAIGMALADRSKNVYCLVSDGECAEGIIWESLRIKRHNFINNLFVYVNFNGWGAYDKTYADLSEELEEKECIVRYANINNFPKWMQGQAGHYHVMKKEEYEAYIR